MKMEIDEYQLRTMTLDEPRQALLELYGIGPGSVGYILIDVFHRWDELTHISPWEQKIYSHLFFGTEPTVTASVQELIDFFKCHFDGYKMLAVNYIWEYGRTCSGIESMSKFPGWRR